MSFTQPARVPDDAHVSDEDYDRFYRPRRKREPVTDPRDPAYDDRHQCLPEECLLCRALVDETNDEGYCPDCVEDVPLLEDAPCTAADFSNPAPQDDEEVPF